MWKHVAIKNINVFVIDGFYFHIAVSWLKFSLFSSAPAGKFWASTSIRLRPFQQISFYPVMASVSTSKLRRQFYVCPIAGHKYFCETEGRGKLKCDGTRAETRFRLSAKRTNPFKSAGASVQSTAGSRGVRISGSNAGNTMFRSSVKITGYPLHSPGSPSLPLLCVTVCYHISTGVYRSTHS
jgi:hypothetical protein